MILNFHNCAINDIMSSFRNYRVVEPYIIAKSKHRYFKLVDDLRRNCI